MDMELTGMQRVPESMRTPIQQYADRVRELGQTNVLSLTLYGPIVAGSFDSSRHTARNVLVLESVDLDLLRRLAQFGAKLGKARIAAPLIMTPAYIKASLDTFPLELIEIKQCHATIFGEDRFEDLSFQDAHIRLQCERQFKTILIAMRQGLLAAAGREKFIGALEQEAAEGIIRTLRGLLWLKGKQEARPAKQVVGDVEDLFERKLPGIRQALEASAPHDWEQFKALYGDVEALGKIIDAW